MTIIYPPEEISRSEPLGKKNFELILLWILHNNKTCTWADLKKEIRHSTLSNKLNILKSRGHVEKTQFNQYRITAKGKDRFYELSQAKNKKKRLNYPPKVILRRRNYQHWILWMVYNNNFCKWADFLEAPLSINQSSLSKNMNSLIEKNRFVDKDHRKKEYRITQLGKLEYSNILRFYDLDRQSILEEESRRIKEITKKTIDFFKRGGIKKDEIKFRFLNIVLKLPYASLKSSLDDEEDYNKIMLFLSLNHPSQYPNYISPEDFAKEYDIEHPF